MFGSVTLYTTNRNGVIQGVALTLCFAGTGANHTQNRREGRLFTNHSGVVVVVAIRSRSDPASPPHHDEEHSGGITMEKQVIQSVGFRNIKENDEIVGFQLKIRLPYYRGVFLSQLKLGNLIVDGEVFTADRILWRINGEDFTAKEMRKDRHRHWHPSELATLIVKKPGGLKQGYHDLEYGFCCTHSYMPPMMEELSDPTREEVIFMPEFGHNLHKRRLLIV